MSVVIPERTVDAWVAIEVARKFPRALIWAPTQRQLPDFDLSVDAGKLFILENKAPSLSASQPPSYRITITQRQLYNYLVQRATRNRTFYILPCPPAPPWSVPPLEDRVQWRLAPPCRRWFNVVSAKRLWRVLWAAPLPRLGSPWWRDDHVPPPGAPRGPRSHGLDPCDRATMRALRATTFGEFLDAVDRCEMLPSLRFGGRSRREDYPTKFGPEDYDYDRSRRNQFDQMIAAYVPFTDLRGWPP
jgi:hypothetical protein